MINTNTKKKTNRRENIRFFAIITFLAIVVILSTKLFPAEEENNSSTAEETTIVVITPETEDVTLEPEKDVLTCNITTPISDGGVLVQEEWLMTAEYVKAKNEEKTHSTELYQLTEEEYIDLCRVTFAEASPERDNMNELKSIASTVLKRTHEEETDFPNDVHGVIFQKGQFSTVHDGEIYWFDEPNVEVPVEIEDLIPEVYEAVDAALQGEDPTKVMVTNGAIFFYSEENISDGEMAKRKNIKEKIKFSDTVFYRSLN